MGPTILKNIHHRLKVTITEEEFKTAPWRIIGGASNVGIGMMAENYHTIHFQLSGFLRNENSTLKF
jgi:hypothetical protein